MHARRLRNTALFTPLPEDSSLREFESQLLARYIDKDECRLRPTAALGKVAWKRVSEPGIVIDQACIHQAALIFCCELRV